MTEVEKKIQDLRSSAHVMVDIETLGMNPYLHPLLCIGAMQFNPFTEDIEDVLPYLELDYIKSEGRVFFARLNVEQQAGKEVDFDTLRWWISKPEQAAMLHKWFEAHRNDPEYHNRLRIEQFSEWLNAIQEKYGFVYLWAHGTTFDIPWLKAEFEERGFKWPISYKALNEVRTMISAYEIVTNERFTWPEKIAAHHPLGDIVNQVKVVKSVAKRLGSNLPS